jgi:3-methylcrotonyl-CoA carboxylase alpha subunit
MSRALRHTYVAGGESRECELRVQDGRLRGTVGADGAAEAVDVGVRRLDAVTVRLDHAERSVRAVVVREGDVAWVAIDGRTLALRVEEPGAGAAHHAGEEDFAVSPMTGTLAKVAVAPGQAVAQGAELFVVEAMKMEYVVRAPRAVTIAEVRGAVGGQVEQGGVVVTFEEPA